MKKDNFKKQNSRSNGLSFLISGLILITLYLNTSLQDPFNSPKLWILIITAAVLSGYLVFSKNELLSNRKSKEALILTALFLFSALNSFLFSDNKLISLMGETQRRNGFLDYASLAIVFLYSSLFINFNNVRKLFTAGLIVGVTLAVYGLLQASGNDFVKWNNPYNSVIATLGNPNFSSAVMAILGTMCFGLIFISNFNFIHKIFSFFVFILLSITIYLSDASQGLVALLVGCGVVVCSNLYLKYRILGTTVWSLSAILLTGLILGMLQKGPFVSLIYKDSVSVRGFYWRAGLKMLRENLMHGVGLDRYGANFKLYRESSYAIRYGFDITSTNAHNVPIQMFSTGGIFLGLTYLGVMVFALFRGFKVIKTLNLQEKKLMISLISAFLAFQAQSIVSIDNIGISIWGWVLAGALIALSSQREKFETRNVIRSNNSKSTLLQPVVSGFLTLLTLIVIVPSAQAENIMYKARNTFNPQVSQNLPYLKSYANDLYANHFADDSYKFTISVYLYQSGDSITSIKELTNLAKSDSKNLEALNFLALVYEEKMDFEMAKKYRTAIKSLDPWNARNLLALCKIYKTENNLTLLNSQIEEIQKFASSTLEGKSALTLKG